AEVRGLVKQGVREVTLLGQNVNAYHGRAPNDAEQEWGLGQLAYALAGIDRLERIRYTTSHPRDMDDTLIAAHRDVPQLMPFLHLPVQSGSDKMLTAMNRGHTRDDYRRIVHRLREARTDIALSSDFIVGAPGESDKDFEDTLSLVNEIGFIQAYSFKYSPRPGTPAASMPNQVPDAIKGERLHALQALLEEQQRAFNMQCVGRTMDVLLTGPGRHPGQLAGRSPYLQPVHVTAERKHVGTVKPLRIISAEPNSLGAAWAGETHAAAGA
ncbi:MAG: MiaB/RimO family radical SAM methylthiotransferase, partial [Rhodospirillaceae bacterium]